MIYRHLENFLQQFYYQSLAKTSKISLFSYAVSSIKKDVVMLENRIRKAAVLVIKAKTPSS